MSSPGFIPAATDSLQRHFVSYPKSGRTWIRFILGELGLLPLIEFHHDGFEFSDPARPRHDFDVAARLARYAGVEKLVYLHRDPRDTMVSMYHQVRGRMRDVFEYRGSISEFMRDDYFGAHNLELFRRMWDEVLSKRPFLSVSYEEMHRDAGTTMRGILDYYELDVPPARLCAALAHGSFEQMKRIEDAGLFPEPWLRPRNNAPKIRKGQVGSHRDELGPDDIAYLDHVHGLRTPR